MADSKRAPYWQIIRRSWRLACPRCGWGKLFRGPFRMNPRVPNCNLSFEHEPGFYLGSIYVNYGITAVLVTVGYFGLFYADVMSPRALLATMTVVCIAFPLWFFRYARSLWLGFDQYWDPDQQRAFKNQS